MGLKDLIKGQLIDVIQYQTDDKRILAHRFDDNGKQIMMGAQLTVRPGQVAVFVNEGQIADIFREGLYKLNTSNMPVLTKLRSWKYGFESPFKVDIYFILTDDKIQQPWGTPNKIAIKDPDFGIVRIGANGYYNYRVAQPDVFLRKLVGTDTEFTVDECRTHLNSQFTQEFTDAFAESKVALFDAYGNLVEFAGLVKTNTIAGFEQFGLELIDFILQEIKIPDTVEQAMDQRSTIGAMGGMDMYQRKVMVDSMAQAAVKMAENEGGGMGPMGMQMGAGVAMGGMMGQMMGGVMNPMQQPQAQPQAQVQPQTGTVQCAKCRAFVPVGTKFCPHCGMNMAPAEANTVPCVQCGQPLKEGTKFCGECGAKQEAKKPFCKNCGVELSPGTKFCPECGTAQ